MWSNKAFRYSLITIISLIVLGYLAMVITSIDTYYPGTVINGQDFGFKSPMYVDNKLYKNPADYNLEVVFRDRTEEINGKKIGLTINYIDELNEIKKSQNPFLWPRTFWMKDYNLAESVSYNDDAVDRIIKGYSELDETTMNHPENPEIVTDEDGKSYAIQGDPGNQIEDIDGVTSRIKEALALEESKIDIDEEGFYTEPEYAVDSEAVERCVEYCNNISSLDIEYKYGRTNVPFTSEQLLNTVRINSDYTCTISKSKVKTVLESYSRLHDTYGSIRTFRSHDRNKIKIIDGDYGWKINIDEETEQLYSDLIHHNSVTRAPVFEEEGYYYNEEDKNDIGGFYAEVDLDKQHMYVYKNGRMVNHSDVVTGCVNKNRATPVGIYSIDYKQTPAVLKGDDYETKVTYWMPFNGGVGFHDATWRGSFGKDIYITNGSHGCVNLPYTFAQELFNTIEEGMPVIVY